MTAAHLEIPSPCVRRCCLTDDDICLGCFRSLQEILRWSESNTAIRQIILEETRHRRQAYTLRRLHNGDITIQGNDQ